MKPTRWALLKPNPSSNKGLGAEDRRTFARWAANCAAHVLRHFETAHPRDKRPREAIKALRRWVRTGVFHMKDVRRASLDAHAAAREVEGAARYAARAAGQAMATAHAPGHAIAAANYAVKAAEAAGKVKEAQWQWKKLPKRLRQIVYLK